MPDIILPQRFARQPQQSVELAQGYRDAIFMSLFNDGTGRDISPSSNHLLPGVSPTPVFLANRRALSFDGATTYLQTSRSFNPASYTVLAWITPRAGNTGYNRIIDTSHTDGFTLLCLAGSGAWAWVASGSGLSDCVGNIPAAGQRVFLCGTYDGAVARLYEDGKQTASVAWATPTFTSQPITVGTNLGFAQYFDGVIESPGVFPRAFSATEIWAIYQDPYRLFKAPVRRLWYQAAAGGASFNPAWARNSNVMVGAWQ